MLHSGCSAFHEVNPNQKKKKNTDSGQIMGPFSPKGRGPKISIIKIGSHQSVNQSLPDSETDKNNW